MSLWVKVCGVTSVDDALFVADAGVDAIGLNFVEGSKRRISADLARDIVRAVGRRVSWVAVVANQSTAELRVLRESVGFDFWQLHGHEEPDAVAALLPDAFKALPISTADDVRRASAFPGERVLVDAKVEGELGGTGRVFDWSLLGELTSQRRVILAGGLTPANVARAVREVRPYGVDTASGVESVPGKKDRELVARFVAEARRADETAAP